MISALVTLKSFVPFGIYVARFFVETWTLSDKSFAIETAKRFGPDLSSMGLILSSFNLLQRDTTFSRLARELGSWCELCYFVYVILCIILWALCLLAYRRMKTIESSTRRAKVRKAGHWAVSVMVAFVLFSISVILQ